MVMKKYLFILFIVSLTFARTQKYEVADKWVAFLDNIGDNGRWAFVKNGWGDSVKVGKDWYCQFTFPVEKIWNDNNFKAIQLPQNNKDLTWYITAGKDLFWLEDTLLIDPDIVKVVEILYKDGKQKSEKTLIKKSKYDKIDLKNIGSAIKAQKHFRETDIYKEKKKVEKIDKKN